MKRLSTILISMPLLFKSCFDKNIDNPVIEPIKNPEIILNVNSVELRVTQTYQLEAELIDLDGEITWLSSDSNICNVSSDGLLTATGEGKCAVVASIGEYSKACNISVIENDYSLSISSNQILLPKGKTFNLEPKMMLNNQEVLGATYTFDVKNNEVISIDNKGVISALKFGLSDVVISASYKGLTLTKEAFVKVNSGYTISLPDSNIRMYKTSLDGEQGEVQISATVKDAFGEKVLGAKVNWSVADETIISVSQDGSIKALKKGETILTASYITEDEETLTASSNIEVYLLEKELNRTFEMDLLGKTSNSIALPEIDSINLLSIDNKKVSSSSFTLEGNVLTIDNSVLVDLELGEEYSFKIESNDFSYQSNLTVYTKIISNKTDLYEVLEENAKAQSGLNYNSADSVAPTERKSFGGVFTLKNDIDCEGDIFYPINSSEGQGKALVMPKKHVAIYNSQGKNDGFKGRIYGNGHAISNFSFDISDINNYIGIFGQIGDGAILKDLIIEYKKDKLLSGNGGILAYNILPGSNISNVLIKIPGMSDTINGAKYTSVFAHNVGGKITNCLVIYKGETDINNHYLFAFDCTIKTAFVNCYAVSKVHFTHLINETNPNAETQNIDCYESFESLILEKGDVLVNLKSINYGYYWFNHLVDLNTIDIGSFKTDKNNDLIIEINDLTPTEVSIENVNINFSFTDNKLIISKTSFEQFSEGTLSMLVYTEKTILSAEIGLYTKVIKTKADLYDFFTLNSTTIDNGGKLMGTYCLANSIDCGGDKLDKRSSTAAAPRNVLCNTGFTDSSVAWSKGFGGTFDGCGYAIYNFELNWINEGTLFGAICIGGTVKNTLIKYKENTKWNGYKGIVAQQITGNFNTCMVVLDSINDNAQNGIICYKSFQNPSVKHNIVYYRGTGNISNAKLFCNTNGNYQAQFLVGITAAEFSNLTGNATNDSYCKVVSNLEEAVSLKTSDTNYKTALNLLSFVEGNYYFGNVLIG